MILLLFIIKLNVCHFFVKMPKTSVRYWRVKIFPGAKGLNFKKRNIQHLPGKVLCYYCLLKLIGHIQWIIAGVADHPLEYSSISYTPANEKWIAQIIISTKNAFHLRSHRKCGFTWWMMSLHILIDRNGGHSFSFCSWLLSRFYSIS
jgi:hypothetical protein